MGGDGFEPGTPKPAEAYTKTCPACLLRTYATNTYCPRCFTNLVSGEPWADVQHPPNGMRERFCARCGLATTATEVVRVSNPHEKMGFTWCRACASEVKNGAPAKIFAPQKAGGRCFIATACYGDCDHPDVVVLRGFRDRSLLPNGMGRALVAAYYRLSPPLAAVLARHKRLRDVIRWTLVRPIV
jgi:hypothetical protein